MITNTIIDRYISDFHPFDSQLSTFSNEMYSFPLDLRETILADLNNTPVSYD